MRKSKLHYIKLNKIVDEEKYLEMFKVIYNGYIDNTIFIKSDIKENETYSYWSFEESYLKLDDYTYLLKLTSGFSPNDTAGAFEYLDKYSNPLVLDLNVDTNSYPPLGFKFSTLDWKDNEVSDFFNDIKKYKDCNKGDFFYKGTKQELIDIVECNDINISRLNDLILDEIDEKYLMNKDFDKNASDEINQKFLSIFVYARKEFRSIMF